MQKKFKFTNAKLKAIKPHDKYSPSTELELSDDSDVSGLKLLVGKSGNKRFLLRYTFQSRKCSIAIGKFGDIDVATAYLGSTMWTVYLESPRFALSVNVGGGHG